MISGDSEEVIRVLDSSVDMFVPMHFAVEATETKHSRLGHQAT